MDDKEPVINLSEEQNKASAEKFFAKMKNFPPETERKEIIFESLKNICLALGCGVNYNQFSLEWEGDDIILTINKNTYTQSVEHDSAAALYEDTFLFLKKYLKELQIQ